jgi:ATP-dependent protease ClpP protease subunit
MLQQPRVPPTGQRQAIEVHIKWREVLDYKRELLRCLSIATGWGVDKLDADMQRPLYMRPQVRLLIILWIKKVVWSV